MKRWELTLKRPVTGISEQTYAVMADTEEDAIKLFSEAFENGQDNLLRDGEMTVTIEEFGKTGTAVIEGTETELEIEF